ncbi:MAG: hypothetical protein EOP84_13825 [Verrucomicrobiaceae bacterium]|nr:MAG: hypothetical protein EOP84_13825 [Verrucomicrobiaceae bacterium]
MRTLILVLLLLCGGGPLCSPPPASAEDLRFPEDAVTDVTKAPYLAKGDGVADDTLAIQAALSDRKNKLIYLPNGTYLVSDQLRWAKGEKRQVLQGQSRDGVILRLKDATAAFADPAKPLAVIWTGKAPAQRLRNGIRNLTVDTGTGNPGAIGIQFMANNQGTMDTVRIRCGDRGPIGLDLGYTEAQGPCFIYDLEVVGFDAGILTKGEVHSITFEQLRLEGQREVGFRNEGQCVSIRGLQSKGSVPVFQNSAKDGVVVLLDSFLEGSGTAVEHPAVLNEKMNAMLVRGLKTSGFQSAVKNLGGHEQSPEGAAVVEWFSHPHLSLFPSPERTLNLPIKDAPEVPWDDPRDWISVTEFKPKKGEVLMPNGKTAKLWDWTDAIQQAIDSGKSTVYFPKAGMAFTLQCWNTKHCTPLLRQLCAC